MALQKTQSGKVDKRTKEYKEMCANLAKARAAQKKSGGKVKVKKSSSSVMRTKSGKIDKRTKAGKEACARMAKARAAKGSLVNRIARLFFN